MTIHYKTHGFIFKKNNLNESDRVFSVFTSDFGKLDIFAKAIRKPVSKLRSGIDLFFLSDIEFIQGKSRKTLTDAVGVQRQLNLQKDPQKFKIAMAISEVLDNFIKGQERDQNLFNLLNETFKILDAPNFKLQVSRLYYYFLWNFIFLQGFKPEIEKCNICSEKLNPYNIYFSNKSGGIICKRCISHDGFAKKINSDTVKLLRLILKKDWQIIQKLGITQGSWKIFKDISDNYYSYILSGHSFAQGAIINTI